MTGREYRQVEAAKWWNLGESEILTRSAIYEIVYIILINFVTDLELRGLLFLKAWMIKKQIIYNTILSKSS